MERYNGNQKGFIYVSCDAKHQKEAFEKYLEPLDGEGTAFWWADDFDKKEEKTLARAKAVLLFLTKDYVKESKLRDTLTAAIKYNKPVLCVYLEDVELDAALSMQTEAQQALFVNKYGSDDDFIKELKKAAIFEDAGVSAQQEGAKKKRSLVIAAAVIVVAILLFALVIRPMMTPKANAETMAALGLQGMSKEDLESIEELRIVGTDIMEYDTYARYADGGKTSIEYSRDDHDNAADDYEGVVAAGNISDLSGLEQMKNLRVLIIEGQQIEDLSPVYGLENLEVLSVNCNPVSSIEGIEKLKNLRMLDISYTDVSDISPVFGMEKLSRLRIDGTKVSDLSGIENMKRLYQITFSDTGVAEVPDGLKLRLVVAHDSALRAIPDLGGSKDVFLSAQNVDITDFSKLSSAGSYELINIEANGKDDQIIKALNGKTIDKADILNSGFGSIKELSGWNIGEELELTNGALSSVEGIEEHDGIETLDLRNCNNLTDLSPVNGLSHKPVVILSPSNERLRATLNEDVEVRVEG